MMLFFFFKLEYLKNSNKNICKENHSFSVVKNFHQNLFFKFLSGVCMAFTFLRLRVHKTYEGGLKSSRHNQEGISYKSNKKKKKYLMFSQNFEKWVRPITFQHPFVNKITPALGVCFLQHSKTGQHKKKLFWCRKQEVEMH